MSKKIKIRVWHFATQGVFEEYNDWYDLADFIKQENLAGRSVTVYRWEYHRP